LSLLYYLIISRKYNNIESLREMEENQIDEHLLQEMLQDSPVRYTHTEQ